MGTLDRVVVYSSIVLASFTTIQAADEIPGATFKLYCFQCHGKAAAGGINLEKLATAPEVESQFQHWQKVAAALEQHRMPPKQMPQPTEAERGHTVAWIQAKLKDYADKNDGDPGRVTVRRLTSGEYAYAISDLTGLDLKLDRDFATDSVGGEGFTNFGDVQFMADANLERYLETAKRVADHAVIGAGPLEFFDNPGKSGLELSAIHRIQEIYEQQGFRSNSGEGGKPYGLEHYSKAFYVCWQYRHRAALGEPGVSLEALARREGVSTKFAEHIWKVLNQPSPTYPASTVVSRWRALRPPLGNTKEQQLAAAKVGASEVMEAVVNWPRWLFAAGGVAEGGQGDERALVLNDAGLKPSTSQQLKYPLRNGKEGTSKVFLSFVPVNPGAKDKPLVLVRDATVRIRRNDKAFGDPQPLRELLDAKTVEQLGFGKRPDGGVMEPTDFAVASDQSVSFDIPAADGAAGALLQVTIDLVGAPGSDAVIRCVISDREEVSKGRPVWALLGNGDSPGFREWKSNVLEFAANLPQNSQGEPAPSDKDPIPAPFDNTYNQPERDRFHAKIKYFRNDAFLVDNILDYATRLRLDHAWDDLLASFDYHDLFLRFVADKYHLGLGDKRIATLTQADIDGMAAEPRKYVSALRAEYEAVQKAEKAAHPRHLDDCLEFASRAWRRPLTGVEKDRLRSFYVQGTEAGKLDHGRAIESLLARILVAPSFLYRLEQPGENSGVKALSDWDLAGRLSFFLWSSIPDEELRRAASAGELGDSKHLAAQVKRMLADPKARRFSAEFFGQWLGFYHFDQYKGVDTTRFPEFTGEVKSAMYDEAVSFFEYILRNDRPVREILFADYTFLNKPLAKHYGIKREVKSAGDAELVQGAAEFQRGGLLRLGAVLTATSAPLRTSPVKRGDWVLRRVLGTPTPPPPANAGSIPADEKLFGGLSVKARLAAHQRNASCASCHLRIDPMGFPLEHYDSVGRWRETYSDGKPIDDGSELADQTRIAGVDGLLTYLKSQEPQVLRTMLHKLIGYALGRTVLPSDQRLVDKLVENGSDATFSQLAAEIATSRQFRSRREQDNRAPVPKQQSSVTPAVKRATKEGGL